MQSDMEVSMSVKNKADQGIAELLDSLGSEPDGLRKQEIVDEIVNQRILSYEQYSQIRKRLSVSGIDNWPALTRWLDAQELQLHAEREYKRENERNSAKPKSEGFWAKTMSARCPVCNWALPLLFKPGRRPAGRSFSCPDCQTKLKLDSLTVAVNRIAAIATVPTLVYLSVIDQSPKLSILVITTLLATFLIATKLERLVKAS